MSMKMKQEIFTMDNRYTIQFRDVIIFGILVISAMMALAYFIQ